MIFEVRGKQVILDSNLAKLYQMETKRINKAVKRNLEKFPERYTFILNDEEIKILQNTFSKFDTFSNEIFFEGQIWDAHSLLLDIFNSSNKNIVIIDNYISKELLDVVCKTSKIITIYTKNIDNIMINKYKSQYNNLGIHINNKIHDRFIIIDDSILYHSGASFKDLGKKCFAINRIEDNNILKELQNKFGD